MGLNLGLAIVFLVLRGIEWSSLNFTWASDAHGSIVWAILFLHSYDIVADVLMTAVLIVIVASGRYGPASESASMLIASCGTSSSVSGFRSMVSFTGRLG